MFFLPVLFSLFVCFFTNILFPSSSIHNHPSGPWNVILLQHGPSVSHREEVLDIMLLLHAMSALWCFKNDCRSFITCGAQQQERLCVHTNTKSAQSSEKLLLEIAEHLQMINTCSDHGLHVPDGLNIKAKGNRKLEAWFRVERLDFLV